jgi:cytochrome c-type biogenesis protein
MVLADIFSAFVLGLLTPLGAVCVLPLYPGFLAYLSSKFSGEEKKSIYIIFGLIVALGVILAMTLVGLIFSTILKTSLTNVVGILSPIAFGILAIVSVFLILGKDPWMYLPKIKTPGSKNPYVHALLFGLFFGAIVLPCNPAFIAALFARVVSVSSFFSNMLSFFSFGLGMSAPLLLFSVVSASASQEIIGWLSTHSKKINRIAGIIMFVISLYYLIFVFQIFGDLV